MKTLKEIFVEEIVHDELDLQPPFYVKGEDEHNWLHQEIIYSDQVTWQDSPSIDIDTAIASLQELKTLGATRVYLFAHSDHHGYYLTGVRLEEASEADRLTESQKYVNYLKKKLAKATRQVEAIRIELANHEHP